MIRILFEFIKKKENQIFNKQDIFTANNQEILIFKIYLKKYQLLDFINLINKELVKISICQNILVIGFLKLLSQNKHRFSYKCQSKLTKTLLKFKNNLTAV